MATVALIDGRIVEGVELKDIHQVGDEGSKSATAHLDGRAFTVYNSIVDGFSHVWYEQTTIEEWIALKEE